MIRRFADGAVEVVVQEDGYTTILVAGTSDRFLALRAVDARSLRNCLMQTKAGEDRRPEELNLSDFDT